MKDAREIHVALTLLCIITLTVVPYAQQTAQPSGPLPTPSSTVPRSVPFNGQLMAPTGDARTGSVMLTFGLYTDQQGGTPLWTEQQLVTVEAGRYAVVLGGASAEGLPAEAFAAATPKWLGVQVEGEAEQPRFMLLSVPYALKAGDADTVGGKPASEFVLNTHLFETVTSTLKQEGYAPRGLSAPTSTTNVVAKFTDGSGTIGDSNMVSAAGNVGINVAPSYPLHVFGAATYQTLRLDSAHAVGSSFTLGPAGFAGEHTYSLLATGPAASTGAGFLTVYDEVAGQYRLVINPNGNVGIGTTVPGKRLHISTSTNSGHLAVGGANQNAMIFGNAANSVTNGFLVGRSYSSDDANTFFIYDLTANINRLLIDAGGNVGIGTTSPTSARLQVNGGSGNGVYGISTVNRGVWGESSTYQGVFGKSNSNAGVVGEANLFHGVFGISHSVNNAGVYGENDANGSGIAGVSAAVSLTAAGVYGKNDPGIGVIGESKSNHGVFGVSTGVAGTGVYARNLGGGRAFYAEGDAGQQRDKGGMVKAMVYVQQDGAILRCYNGVTGAPTVPCGFTVNNPAPGFFDINFGFQIDDRFIATTPLSNPDSGGCYGGSALVDVLVLSSVRIRTACSSGYVNKPFMIFVY